MYHLLSNKKLKHLMDKTSKVAWFNITYRNVDRHIHSKKNTVHFIINKFTKLQATHGLRLKGWDEPKFEQDRKDKIVREYEENLEER